MGGAELLELCHTLFPFFLEYSAEALQFYLMSLTQVTRNFVSVTRRIFRDRVIFSGGASLRFASSKDAKTFAPAQLCTAPPPHCPTAVHLQQHSPWQENSLLWHSRPQSTTFIQCNSTALKTASTAKAHNIKK